MSDTSSTKPSTPFNIHEYVTAFFHPDSMLDYLDIVWDDLFTFLSNKSGHCRQGTIVAAVRGTRAEDVIGVLMQIPKSIRQ